MTEWLAEQICLSRSGYALALIMFAVIPACVVGVFAYAWGWVRGFCWRA